MNKKVFLIYLQFLSILLLTAQNFNFQPGTFVVDCSSGGVLFDSGGPGANYGNNENTVMTICPGNPGFGVFATIAVNDIPQPDALCIYDGNNTSAPLLPGNFNGDCFSNNTDLEAGGVFQSSVANSSGCLTFEFNSDGAQTGNFRFNLSCQARCQQVLSGIAFSIPDTVVESGSTYVNLCLGDTLFLRGSATFPQNNTEYPQSEATSTFQWTWGDGSPNETSQNVQHVYSSPGGYLARLSVFDVNGCRNAQDQVIKVRVAPIPEFVELEDSILCLGLRDTLVGLPQGVVINGQIVQGDTVYFIPPAFSGDSIPLPDGSGVGYNSSVFLSSFENNSQIVNCGDILEVCINLEHSYLGDLEITLICPNGQSAVLKAYPGGGALTLGNAIQGSINQTGVGQGDTYCFTSAATTLLVNGPTAPSPTYTGRNKVLAGDYRPVQPFTNFVGCPINGEWTLNITDNLFIDDGYLFNWELNVNPCMYPEVDSFIMLYDFGYWDNDPSIVGIVNDSNTIIIEPITQGLQQYTYYTQNQFGCEYSNTYEIFVDGFDVEATPSDTIICSTDTIPLNATITGVPLVCEPDYTISQIPLAMIPGTGTNVSLGDDALSAAINLPFPFDFYCATKNAFRISSNGFITFVLTGTANGCCSGQNIPNPSTPNDLIALVWQDLHPGQGGTISHYVSGTAPNRVYVIQFDQVPYIGSTVRVTGQIQLFEGSNIVEIHCRNCPQRNTTANATLGLENATGTIAHSPAGFNATPFSAVNRAWRFIPANSLGAFTFEWTPTSGLNNPNILNPVATVSTSTQYVVSATNLNGCTYSDTVNITVGGNFIYSVPNDTIICLGDSVQLIVTGNGETFAWTPNNGSISDTTISNPWVQPSQTTTYTVEIDSAGCSVFEAITVTVIGVQIDETLVENESCAGAGDGSIEIIPFGPVVNALYSIDGGITFETGNLFTGLGPGNYDIVVGGGIGCDTTYTVTIFGGNPLSIDSVYQLDPTCGNTLDGVVEVFASGGFGMLQYSLDGGTTFQSTGLFSNLLGGSYNIRVVDSVTCFVDTSITILQPDPIVIAIDSVVNILCFGDANGAIFVSASGSNPGYEYSIDNINFASIGVFENLTGGNYTVYVRDSGSCLDSLTVNVLFPDSLAIDSILIQNASCVGESDGSMNIFVSGGTQPYLYSIDGGNTYVSSQVFGNLVSGNYNVIVQDDNFCESLVSVVFVDENQPLDPTFTAIPNVCQNATAPVLPSTSLNGISGTWSPAVSTATVGTTTYTFMPNANECANITTLDITVIENVVPQFNAIPDVCQGATAPVLPTTSLNGINGTWSPAVSTATPGTFTYTFTPNSGVCATTATIQINVLDPIVPQFNSIAPVCQGSPAPVLPTTSLNGINGTWNPAVSTATPGTFTYTFTPNTGICATTATLEITVTNAITPLFSAVSTLCVNSTPPVLPTISNNGIIGSWDRPVTTNAAGTTTYFFTPDPGQCAVGTSLNVSVTNPVTPTFATIGDICQGTSAPNLPVVSLNGITGVWSPSTINSALPSTTTHTFTPNPNQCAVSMSVDIVVVAPVVPDFEPFEPVCQGYGTQLPSISLNGVSGSWTPAVVTELPGTFSYVFVPSGNQCALQVSAELEVLPSDSSTRQDFTCFASEAGESITIFSNQQGCDSVVITVTTLLSNDYAVFPDFVSIRAGESFEFIINNEDNNLEFSWISTDGQTCNPPCQSYLVTATNDITNYYFTFVDTSTGCVNNDTMRVKLEYFSELNVPNIFTPNNDGQNDVYRVYGTDLFDFSLMIFDRWGGKVFETTNINEGWDGNFKGQPLQSGVYVALIQATGLDAKKYEITQNIKLVR
jgi:gliding motility-associated-like protein